MNTTTKARETGTLVSVYDTIIDGEEVWVTYCEEHGQSVDHPTKSLAIRHRSNPTGWCSECHASASRKQEYVLSVGTRGFLPVATFTLSASSRNNARKYGQLVVDKINDDNGTSLRLLSVREADSE
jgi:hypothetical protein